MMLYMYGLLFVKALRKYWKQHLNCSPVLKKAGVVDAGGKGLCLILDGMLSVFKDNVLIADEMPVKSEQPYEDDFFRNAAAEFDQDITFTYCTEFIIGREETCTKPPFELRAYLESIETAWW